jgi:hypothetical protein
MTQHGPALRCCALAVLQQATCAARQAGENARAEERGEEGAAPKAGIVKSTNLDRLVFCTS